MALRLVFAGAVHSADGLYGIDVPDFLVQEQRVQLRLVKTRLQLIDHDNQSVLLLSEIANHLLFRQSIVERCTGRLSLAVAIHDGYGCIGIFGILRLSAFLCIYLFDDVQIGDGVGYGRYRQHCLSLSLDFQIDKVEQTLHHKLRNLPDARLKGIDLRLVLTDNHLIFQVLVLQFWRKDEVNGHSVWEDMFRRVEYIAVGNGFLHGVMVEGLPQGRVEHTAVFAESGKRLLAGCGCETDEQVLLLQFLSSGIECFLQSGENVDHHLVVLA